MLNNEIKSFSFEKDNELKLKSELTKFFNESGYEKAFFILSSRNDLLLKKCNIDQSEFVKILFKNYMYYVAKNEELNIKGLDDIEKRMINDFDYCIKNNDFNEALNIGSNCYTVYQILCLLYINNLGKNDKDKLIMINKDKVMNTCRKIALLDNTNFNIKRKEYKKIHQIVSNR